MKKAMEIWVTGWRIMGRLMLIGFAWAITSLLFLPVRWLVESELARGVIALALLILIGPFIAFRAAAAANLCRDLTREG
ncbi:MAG TPA: hypothetical protein VL527_15805 [Dongiaceae bacterium]|nr:hypothetical protein [Dongiaceae bacterium]